MSGQRDDGGPAFPDPGRGQSGKARESLQDTGMSLRDYFAARAMAALAHSEIGKSGYTTVHGVAADAYKLADAMLEERAK